MCATVLNEFQNRINNGGDLLKDIEDVIYKVYNFYHSKF